MSTTHVKLLLRGTPAQGLWGATSGFFFGFAAVSLYGPTAALFRKEITLSPIFLALLIAAPSLSGSLLRIPFSAWVDTTGGRKPFLILLWASVVGMAGLTVTLYLAAGHLSEYYAVLLLFGVLAGCGIATFSVGISQTSYWFPVSRQGVALGAFAGVGNLAPGIFSFLIPLVALPLLGLQGAYLAWLIFLILGTLIYTVFGKNAWYFQALEQGGSPAEARAAASEKGQELFPKGRLVDSLTASARISATWYLVFVYFTTFGGFIALTGWFPTYWQGYFGLSMKQAGMLTGVYAILASLIRVSGGVWADRWGGKIVGLGSLTVMLVGALLITLSTPLWGAIFGMVLMAGGMGITNAAVFKLVPRAVPDAIGGAAGWVGGLGAFGGFAIPPALAMFLAGHGEGDSGYRYGFMVFAALAVLSLLAIIRVREK